MIQNTKQKFAMEGDVPTLMTDLTVIVRNMIEQFQKNGIPEEEVKNMINHSVELAFKSRKEIVEEVVSKIREMQPEKMLDFMKDLLGLNGKEESKSVEDYKVWCETEEIKEKALKKFDADGLKWKSGANALDLQEVRNAPMGLHIYKGGILQSSTRFEFNFDDAKEVKAEDLIQEAESNE